MIENSKPVYVVAVSGGVDSVVLLDMLARGLVRDAPFDQPYKLVVAHFDHGIRPDSVEDRLLAERLAVDYGLPFEYEEGRLGADASEAAARQARYDFLRRVRDDHGAAAIVTAHHEDDALETAIINLLRGTGRKGLSSLRSTSEVVRPLLSHTKAALSRYAHDNQLRWREDSTNLDTKYLRNYIRHVLLAQATPAQRQRLLELVSAAQVHNPVIDDLLTKLLASHTAVQAVHGTPDYVVAIGEPVSFLERRWFNDLPPAVGREIMAAWLRQHNVGGFDRKLLDKLSRAGAELTTGKRLDINRQWLLCVLRHQLALVRHDR